MADDENEEQIQQPKAVRHATVPAKYSGARGSNPAQHLASFAIAARGNHWNENLKLIQFPGSLTGFALSWYLAASERLDAQGEEWTWASLRREFLSHGTQGLFSTDLEFLLTDKKQKEGESCLEFYFALDQLISAVDPHLEEERRIKIIKRGLRSAIFSKINAIPFTTMEELTVMLESIDEADEKEKREAQRTQIEIAEEDILVNKAEAKPPKKDERDRVIQELTDRLDRLEAGHSSYRQPYPRMGDRSRGGRYMNRRVQALERQQDWGSPPENSEPQPSRNESSRCYACNERGHFARECRNVHKNGYRGQERQTYNPRLARNGTSMKSPN